MPPGSVEFRAAAVKRGRRVIRPQRPWLEELHRLGLFEEARPPQKLAQFGQAFGRSIQARAKLRPVPAVSADEWHLPKPRDLGWKGLSHAEVKEQAQLTSAELQHGGKPKRG
jgi:hypothetical protein